MCPNSVCMVPMGSLKKVTFDFWPPKMTPMSNFGQFWPFLVKFGKNFTFRTIFGGQKSKLETFLRDPIGTMHTRFAPIWVKTAEFYRVLSYLAMKNMIFSI